MFSVAGTFTASQIPVPCIRSSVLLKQGDKFVWIRMNSSDGSKKTDFAKYVERITKKNGKPGALLLSIYGVRVGTDKSNGFYCVSDNLKVAKDDADSLVLEDKDGKKLKIEDIKPLGTKPVKEWTGEKHRGLVMGDGHITVTDKKRVFHFPISRQDQLSDAKVSKCCVEAPPPKLKKQKKEKKEKKKATPSSPAVSSSSGKRKDVDPLTPTIDSKRQKSIDPPDEPEPPPDEPDPPPNPPPPDPESISCGCSDCVKDKCACEHCKTRY